MAAGRQAASSGRRVKTRSAALEFDSSRQPALTRSARRRGEILVPDGRPTRVVWWSSGRFVGTTRTCLYVALHERVGFESRGEEEEFVKSKQVKLPVDEEEQQTTNTCSALFCLLGAIGSWTTGALTVAW